MHKHAYLLLVHKNPKQIKKLLELLDHELNDIFIHIDKRSDMTPALFEGVCKKSRLVSIPRIDVQWGGTSIMNAEFELLRAAVPGVYRYYHLLSGMDLPIKSQDDIHKFFEENDGREFLTLWPNNKQTFESFHYRTIFPENNRFILAKKIKAIYRFIEKKLNKTVNNGIQEKFASQWFSITHDFARFILDNEKWAKKVFHLTSQTDELFVPTLLFRSPFAKNLYDANEYKEKQGTHEGGSLRFIDWTGEGIIRHPKTFRTEDFDRIMKSGCFWARKFDENTDSEIIDRIYACISDTGTHQPESVEETAQQS